LGAGLVEGGKRGKGATGPGKRKDKSNEGEGRKVGLGPQKPNKNVRGGGSLW